MVYNAPMLDVYPEFTIIELIDQLPTEEGVFALCTEDNKLYLSVVYAPYGDITWYHTTVTSPGTMMLLLDDERDFKTARFPATPSHHARTLDEARDLVNRYGLPRVISFDHDLGASGETGLTFMWELINGHLDGIWDCSVIKEVRVHSSNPPGAENLMVLWEGFCEFHGLTCKPKRIHL